MTHTQRSEKKPVNQFKIRAYSVYKNALEKIQLINFLNKRSPHATQSLYIGGIANSLLDIVTIAYNHPHMTALQIQLIKKNIKDPFTHIVADNSSNPAEAEKIFQACMEHGAEYVRIPLNPFKRNKSHAAAMHWAYKNVLKKRKAPYLGFLDHDIFPTQSFSIIESMRNDIYGRPTHLYNQHGEWEPRTTELPYWSLWAGLYFLKSDLLARTNVYRLSFTPKFIKNGLHLDTGGGLWDSVYQYLPYPESMIQYRCVQFRESTENNIHTDYYEYYDDWIHIVNLSNWYATPNFKEKLNYFENLLNSQLAG